MLCSLSFSWLPNDLLLSTDIGGVGCLPHRTGEFYAPEESHSANNYLASIYGRHGGKPGRGCREEQERILASSGTCRCGFNNHRGQEMGPHGVRN